MPEPPSCPNPPARKVCAEAGNCCQRAPVVSCVICRSPESQVPGHWSAAATLALHSWVGPLTPMPVPSGTNGDPNSPSHGVGYTDKRVQPCRLPACKPRMRSCPPRPASLWFLRGKREGEVATPQSLNSPENHVCSRPHFLSLLRWSRGPGWGARSGRSLHHSAGHSHMVRMWLAQSSPFTLK